MIKRQMQSAFISIGSTSVDSTNIYRKYSRKKKFQNVPKSKI